MNAFVAASLVISGVAVGNSVATVVQARRIIKLCRKLEPRIANLEPPTTEELRSGGPCSGYQR